MWRDIFCSSLEMNRCEDMILLSSPNLFPPIFIFSHYLAASSQVCWRTSLLFVEEEFRETSNHKIGSNRIWNEMEKDGITISGRKYK